MSADWTVEIPEAAPTAVAAAYDTMYWSDAIETHTEAGPSSFTGFRIKVEEDSEITASLRACGVPEMAMTFSQGGKEEQFFAFQGFDGFPLISSVMPMSMVGRDYEAVNAALTFNAVLENAQAQGLRLTEEYKTAATVLRRTGYALGWAPKRDFNSGAETGGSQSFMRVPFLVRRLIVEKSVVDFDCWVPVVLNVKSTISTNLEGALVAHQEFVRGMIAIEGVKTELNTLHDAYVADMEPAEAAAVKKSLKLYHVSMRLGYAGTEVKGNGAKSKRVKVFGRLSPENVTIDVVKRWLHEAKHREFLEFYADEAKEWALTTSWNAMSPPKPRNQ
jgi:hypothetical protein